MYGPSPEAKHPMAGFPQICFIRNTVRSPHIIVGEYTYYDDPENPEDFERNVLYHFPFVGDRLVIGKLYAIARGVRFIMNGHNHRRRRRRPGGSCRGWLNASFFVGPTPLTAHGRLLPPSVVASSWRH